MTTETVTDHEPRCWRCKRKLANALARPWDIDCPRCKAANKRDVVESA